jgi:4'-phosphopantetheinyl transferase
METLELHFPSDSFPSDSRNHGREDSPTWAVDLARIRRHRSELGLREETWKATELTLDAGQSRHKQRKMLRRAITRRLLARHLQIDAGEVVIRADAYGRPALALKKMPARPKIESLDFSISHSGNIFVMGVISSGRIGMDVEMIRPAMFPSEIDFPAVMQYYFSEAEREWLESLAAPKRIEAFYRCWTAKEAMVKAIGLGATFGFDQVETQMVGDAMCVARLNGSKALAQGWTLDQQILSTGASDAVISRVTVMQE